MLVPGPVCVRASRSTSPQRARHTASVSTLPPLRSPAPAACPTARAVPKNTAVQQRPDAARRRGVSQIPRAPARSPWIHPRGYYVRQRSWHTPRSTSHASRTAPENGVRERSEPAVQQHELHDERMRSRGRGTGEQHEQLGGDLGDERGGVLEGGGGEGVEEGWVQEQAVVGRPIAAAKVRAQASSAWAGVSAAWAQFSVARESRWVKTLTQTRSAAMRSTRARASVLASKHMSRGTRVLAPICTASLIARPRAPQYLR
ncbi:hypothetical protein B0H10DRAFT_2431411 [Mycena sp. CBHHK59/15]|nr:hypothetical protein B0H10DRAFT_2431411 [Mycena sp. CBHHK59/15]